MFRTVIKATIQLLKGTCVSCLNETPTIIDGTGKATSETSSRPYAT